MSPTERKGLVAAHLALIETDAAEWTEPDPATHAVLIGNLDSESFAAVGAARTIKVPQRAEHDGHPEEAHRNRHGGVHGVEVACHRENRQRCCGNQAAQSKSSASALRPSSEVFPNLHRLPDRFVHGAQCYRFGPSQGESLDGPDFSTEPRIARLGRR